MTFLLPPNPNRHWSERDYEEPNDADEPRGDTTERDQDLSNLEHEGPSAQTLNAALRLAREARDREDDADQTARQMSMLADHYRRRLNALLASAFKASQPSRP